MNRAESAGDRQRPMQRTPGGRRGGKGGRARAGCCGRGRGRTHPGARKGAGRSAAAPLRRGAAGWRHGIRGVPGREAAGEQWLGGQLAWAISGRADPDLWWHLAIGNWIIAHGDIPASEHWNRFSIGDPFRAYSWSIEILFSFLEISLVRFLCKKYFPKQNLLKNICR